MRDAINLSAFFENKSSVKTNEWKRVMWLTPCFVKISINGTLIDFLVYVLLFHFKHIFNISLKQADISFLFTFHFSPSNFSVCLFSSTLASTSVAPYLFVVWSLLNIIISSIGSAIIAFYALKLSFTKKVRKKSTQNRGNENFELVRVFYVASRKLALIWPRFLFRRIFFLFMSID